MNEIKKIPASFQLTSEQLDLLKEIGNIGSGHAITALSNMLNIEIDVSLTSVEIIPFWKVVEMFENPNSEIFGIYSGIHLNSDLSIIQILSKESVITLINLLNEDSKLEVDMVKTKNDLDDLSLSIIVEIGNILSGHYANALADFLSIKLVPNVPKVAFDTLNAMFNELVAKHSQISDYLVLIKTKLVVKDYKMICIICFIPTLNVLQSLCKILNIKYDTNI
ncbi:MAG: chemotaxis protein CheC [Candidatus Thorarchaeota archaeon]